MASCAERSQLRAQMSKELPSQQNKNAAIVRARVEKFVKIATNSQLIKHERKENNQIKTKSTKILAKVE